VIRFRCPDCRQSLPLAGCAPAACAGCGRSFDAEGGVFDFIPKAAESSKVREDVLHSEDTTEVVWRRLLYNKAGYIREFEDRWLNELLPGNTGSFLELGGGLCYASSLVKAHRPAVSVVATDISRRYLQKQSRKVADIMCAPIDYFAAVDGENLPFEDGQFSAIYCHVVMYRLPDPVRMIAEVKRVLRPGGVFVGIERAFPSLSYFYRRHSGYLDRRSAEQGISEKGRRWRDWERMLAAAGMPATSLTVLPGKYLKGGLLRRMKSMVHPVPVKIRYVKDLA
jgi:ubiquinone/menaquinone biosynthesis C-methylase UbiE